MSIVQFLFGFHGRIRRSHLWLFTITMHVAIGVLFLLCHNVVIVDHGVQWSQPSGAHEAFQRIGANADQMRHVKVISLMTAAPWLGAVGLLVAWMKLAVLVKRWHDRDKSGWWVLIVLIPLIGPIWQFVECFFLDGTQGPNKHGPSPKGIS